MKLNELNALATSAGWKTTPLSDDWTSGYSKGYARFWVTFDLKLNALSACEWRNHKEFSIENFIKLLSSQRID